MNSPVHHQQTKLHLSQLNSNHLVFTKAVGVSGHGIIHNAIFSNNKPRTPSSMQNSQPLTQRFIQDENQCKFKLANLNHLFYIESPNQAQSKFNDISAKENIRDQKNSRLTVRLSTQKVFEIRLEYPQSIPWSPDPWIENTHQDLLLIRMNPSLIKQTPPPLYSLRKTPCSVLRTTNRRLTIP